MSSINSLQIKLLEGGIAPVRMSSASAGYDLISPCAFTLSASKDHLVGLKFSMQLPVGYHAQIWPRSGLDLKHRITTGAGIIDQDYRGEVGVLLRNMSNTDYQINKGDRIAQMVIIRYKDFPVSIVTELSDTVRGEGGFGSTGKQ